MKYGGGYDHNFVLDTNKDITKVAAILSDEKSGRTMTVYTDLPGVQFYAGNFITPEDGKGGYHYEKRAGLCLETQYYPDTIHHENFPSCLFGGSEDDARVYDTVTVYAFE